MTKEEMVKRNLVLSVVLTTAGTGAFNHAYKVMDEYARQQAIEFDKWKRVNGYTIDEHGDYIKLVTDGDFARTEWFPQSEVYDQFIKESQNKKA